MSTSIHRVSWDTSTNKDLFKKLLRDIFDSTDREALVEYSNVVRDIKTSDEYERRARIAGLDYAEEVAEGENIPIQDAKFDSTKDWTQVSYGTGFRVTDRMKRFNKWNLIERWTKSLGRIMKESKDVEIARMFNSASATTYATGFDSLALASASHTCLDDAATTYSNYLNSNLAVASLESALEYFDYMVDDQANIFTAIPTKLVVNYGLRIEGMELLRSSGKPWEESNTLNAFSDWDLALFVYHRLTSTTAWFMLADKDPNYDLFCFTTVEPDMKVEDAPDTTRDTIVTSLQMFKYGFGDPRLCYVGDL